jgi:UDP-3-O-[3-hydroxymyristoyl] glucosamine N-acyltransferase
VIVGRKIKLPSDASGNGSPAVLLVEDAELSLAKVLAMFAPPVPRPPVGKHHTAFVAPSASIGEGAHIGPNVFVGDDARVGRNCVLHAGAYVGADVNIGDDCEFFPNVVVRERVTIGNRVIIHANAAIGTDGFGYRWDGKQHVKVPQIGTVIIEDDVEIGSCACIDRAKFAVTRIGRGTKIDNLVQVAHNVVLGPHCIVAGQAGVAGSAKLGAGVVLGGQSAVRDHITMGDGSMLAACSGVMDDVEPKSIISGLPALPHRQSLREQAALRKLPELVAEVRELQSQVEALKKQLGSG